MKRYFISFVLIVSVVFLHSEEFVTEKGQKVVFTNSTKINLEDGVASDIAENLTYWRNATANLTVTKDGSIVLYTMIEPDTFPFVSYGLFLPHFFATGFYRNIIKRLPERKLRYDFVQCSFTMINIFKFPRGTITFYYFATNKAEMIEYNKCDIEAGGYKAECTKGEHGDWNLKPSYNSISNSWNAGYLYRYVIGDFKSIMDMPVPEGLDASFKKR